MHDDVETREIGKLIDAGHPDLATKAFRSRWRYRWLMRLASVIPLAVAAAWHFAH
jgi:hypothetical protein